MPHICEMVVGTVCNFRGQMVVGDFITPWLNAGSNSVGWSKIGHAEFVLDNSNESGLTYMPGYGKVYLVKPLRSGVVCYGSGSIMGLAPVTKPAVTFGVKDISPNLGVTGRGAVGGDVNQHLILDSRGRLWHLDVEFNFKKIGYSHIFEPIINDDETIIISYDRSEQEFYIGCETAGYVFVPGEGLTQIDQSPTDVWNYEDELHASFKEFTDSKSSFTTGIIDFGLAGVNTITGVSLGGEVNSNDEVRIHYRMDRSNAFSTTPWKRFSPNGECGIRAAGVDLKVEVQFDRQVEVEEYLTVKYQISDKRGIRGPYANQAD